MKTVITPEEAARLDSLAKDPTEVLMDRAGYAVARAAAQMGAGYGKKVLVLCGPGNNGGDGYVAAHYLAKRGAAVEARALGYPQGEDSPARKAAAAAVDAGVTVRPLGAPEPADLVIDALFGAGFHGELTGPAADWAVTARRVLAVDIPSGLDAGTGRVKGTCFTAERTVTFHALKAGHLLGEGPDRCGEVEVIDIGLEGGDPFMLLCEESDAPRPPRPRTAHKWSAGSVLVAGGSPGITGAAMLAARSALAAGAGAVRVAAPAVLQPIYAAMSAEVMTAGIGDGDRFDGADAPALLEEARRFDVLVLGPGLGPDQGKFVSAILEGREGPLLIDADGLNALSGSDQLLERSGPTMLTPHHGEFARITGEDPTPEAARRLAQSTGVVVLLKGNPTIVAGERRWVVASGGPELATIGTGDVLAGLVAALWARGLDAEAAARSGAYWHGRAGAELAASGAVTAERLADAMARWAW